MPSENSVASNCAAFHASSRCASGTDAPGFGFDADFCTAGTVDIDAGAVALVPNPLPNELAGDAASAAPNGLADGGLALNGAEAEAAEFVPNPPAPVLVPNGFGVALPPTPAPPNGELVAPNADPELPPPNADGASVVEVAGVAAPPNDPNPLEATGAPNGDDEAPPPSVEGAPNDVDADVPPNGDELAAPSVDGAPNGLEADAPNGDAAGDEPPSADGAPNAVAAGFAPNGLLGAATAVAPNGFDTFDPNGLEVAAGAAPNGFEVLLLATPNGLEVTGGAPNGLDAAAAGAPNGLDAAVGAAPNGLDAAPPNGLEDAGAPNGEAAAPPPNGLLPNGDAPGFVALEPPNGLLAWAPPNGDTADDVAAPPNAPPPPNGLAPAGCPNALDPPCGGSGSPAKSRCADCVFSSSEMTYARSRCFSARSVATFWLVAVTLPVARSS